MARLARDLGYTLAELGERMTGEELQLWSLIYQVEREEMERASRRRI